MSAWIRQTILMLLMAPILLVALIFDLAWRLEIQTRESAANVRGRLHPPVAKHQWTGSIRLDWRLPNTDPK